jgi:uncharacterized protein YeaO (DUF488 family)
MLKIKRAYEPASPDDGIRILVDRLWPRGVSKEEAHIDEWNKDLSPSSELRKWYGHDPAKWEEFKTKYHMELEQAGKLDTLRDLVRRSKSENVTLVFGAKDIEHSNAEALKEFAA